LNFVSVIDREIKVFIRLNFDMIHGNYIKYINMSGRRIISSLFEEPEHHSSDDKHCPTSSEQQYSQHPKVTSLASEVQEQQMGFSLLQAPPQSQHVEFRVAHPTMLNRSYCCS
jgi:hypothetical protein